MIRLTALLLMVSTSALAGEAHYCNEELPYDVSAVDGYFIIWERPENHVCKRADAVWFKCDGRDDYKVSFQLSDDGAELYLRTPLYKEGEYETFTACQ